MVTRMREKGQVTIPLAMRKLYGVKPYSKVIFEAGEGYIKVSAGEDILDMARKWKFKAPKGKTALKAREWMEKHYRRA